MIKIYRPGAIGAMLDEYERAIADLKKVVETVSDSDLTLIADPETADENCRSIQTVLSHLVHSGYGYATYIHNRKGPVRTRPAKTFHLTTQAYLEDLDRVFVFTEAVFRDVKEEEVEQHDPSLKMLSGWGQLYDIEQMMEHAIVHILRHRRQIEKFIRTIKSRSPVG